MINILEKDLEDYIFEHHNEIPGLEGQIIERQVNLVGYGILDLLIIESHRNINEDSYYPVIKIIELKQGIIDLSAAAQIMRYFKGIKRNLEKIDYYGKKGVPIIQLFLIGNEIDINASYLLEFLESCGVRFITYKISLEKGITLKEEENDWHNKNEIINKNLGDYINNSFCVKENEIFEEEKNKSLDNNEINI